MPDLPDDVRSLEELLFYVKAHQDGRYLTLACWVFIFYEYFINLDLEVKWMWNTLPRITFLKFLFYVNRYFILVICSVRAWVIIDTNPSHELCTRGRLFPVYANVVNFAVIEVMLMLRIWVLYNKTRQITAFLFLLAVCALTAACVLIIKGLPEIPALAAQAPQSVTICPRHSTTQYFALYCVLIMSKTVTFGLMFRQAWVMSSGPSRTPILTSILRHGTIYFAIELVTVVGTLIFLFVPVLAQPALDSNIAIPISSAACTRLILYIRDENLTTDATTIANRITTLDPFRATVTGSSQTATNDYEMQKMDKRGKQKHKPLFSFGRSVSMVVDTQVEKQMNTERYGALYDARTIPDIEVQRPSEE